MTLSTKQVAVAREIRAKGLELFGPGPSVPILDPEDFTLLCAVAALPNQSGSFVDVVVSLDKQSNRWSMGAVNRLLWEQSRERHLRVVDGEDPVFTLQPKGEGAILATARYWFSLSMSWIPKDGDQ